MNLFDALKLLDTDIEKGQYGKNIIVSKSRGDLWLFFSYYGLCTRSRDYPTSYNITPDDVKSDDWELIEHI